MSEQARRTVFIEDIVGSKIVTAEGKKIGRVVELMGQRTGEHEVISLVYGRSAWLYRFHVLHPFVKAIGFPLEPHTIPWHAIERFEQNIVWLKPDTPLPSSGKNV